jgi:DNA polymerase III epsilon subunit-like protein
MLLTYYAATFSLENGKFKLLNEIDLKLKPHDGVYVVTAEAMKVNRIDLVKHDAVARSLDDAAIELFNFLKEESGNGSNRLVRMGHNEAFDRSFVVNNILRPDIFNRFTDYGGVLDTSCMARERKVTGKLPWNTRFKLETLANFLGVHADPKDLHTAKGDTHLMVRCAEKMLSM